MAGTADRVAARGDWVTRGAQEGSVAYVAAREAKEGCSVEKVAVVGERVGEVRAAGAEVVQKVGKREAVVKVTVEVDTEVAVTAVEAQVGVMGEAMGGMGAGWAETGYTEDSVETVEGMGVLTEAARTAEGLVVKLAVVVKGLVRLAAEEMAAVLADEMAAMAEWAVSEG